MDKLKQLWQSNADSESTTSIVVHTFRVSDVEDPDLYAGQPIIDWQQTEAGKWVMENAIQKPSWHRIISYDTYGYMYQIRAELTPKQLIYYKLRFE